MSIDKAHIRSWLDEAHQCLHAFQNIKLRHSVRVLMERIKDALDRQSPELLPLTRRIKELGDTFQARKIAEANEQALILAECAFVAYKIGNAPAALKLLENSLELCNREDGGHLEATVMWMLGCLQLESLNHGYAIVSWETSIELYDDLRRKSSNYLSDATTKWYARQMAVMRSALDFVLGYSESPPSQSRSFGNVQLPAGVNPSQQDSSVFSEQDILRLFTIYNEVHAGNFSSTNGDGKAIGYIEVERFKIEGHPYRMVNLRDSGRVVRYAQSKNYEVMKVTGDSMTVEGIDDGDYVLLRTQNTADNNDIVAAMVFDFDDTATLKKYLVRENKIILRFRSRNPEYKESNGLDRQFEFSIGDERFQIRGVAQAVFKRIQ